MKKTLLVFSFILLIQSFVFPQAKRDATKEHKIEDRLRAINPSVVDIFKQATIALDEQNYPVAESLYTIVCDSVPDFDAALRRLGSVKTATGKTQEGIELCERAFANKKDYDNAIMLASTLVSSGGDGGSINSANLRRAYEVLDTAMKYPDADEAEYTILGAQIDLQLNKTEPFADKAAFLMKKYPDMMVSHYYGAIAYALKEDWVAAENEIHVAGSMGLDEDAVERFLDSGVRSKASTGRYTHLFLWILLFWVVGFVVLYLLGMILSGYTLNSVEKEFRANAEDKKANLLRKIYRVLINIAGVYYYISLPIILILVVVLVVGAFYVCLMVGAIPIKLLLLLLIGGGISIFSMIRSLLVKSNYGDPGRELTLAEAPGLFALTKEVADTMNTRPIDEIRITAETDLAVYERGSWRQKLQDKGKRILILGTGVLKDFEQNDFRAVLAHEYGHFSHRDTAGGAVALSVRKDMSKYGYALYMAGQAVWWNLAFQFLRLYDFIFKRISNGSTRLQEVLADRVAAQTYGSETFKSGLTYVIKRNVEFVKLAQYEIEDARKTKRPFNNLYELTGTNKSVDEELSKLLNRKTDNNDTHPSPVDRFRYVDGIKASKPLKGSGFVRELFVDWNAITLEMTKDIEDSWKKKS